MNQMASKKRTRNAKNEKEGETAETLTFVRIDFSARRPTQRARGFRLTLKKTHPTDLARTRPIITARRRRTDNRDTHTRTRHSRDPIERNFT